MARKVELINDSEVDWELCCFGSIIVPATGSLNVTALISDPELVKSIQVNGLGNEFDAEHYLKINDVAFSAAQSANYMSYEQLTS